MISVRKVWSFYIRVVDPGVEDGERETGVTKEDKS